MNLLDVNVLIDSFRKDTERHDDYGAWLLDLLNGDAAFAISEQVLSSLIRITTHPKIFKEPSSLKETLGRRCRK